MIIFIIYLAGCVHAGVGREGLNNILTTMNLPEMTNTMWYARMEEIENPVTNVTSKTFEQALDEEKRASTEAGETGIKFSFDAGWQHRGSGRSYNSASGNIAFY